MSVTAQRRAFLLETIMGDPVKDEAERAALKRAEAEAVRTKNVGLLVSVRRRQREREVDRARRAERLDALEAVVRRQMSRPHAPAGGEEGAAAVEARVIGALDAATAGAGGGEGPVDARDMLSGIAGGRGSLLRAALSSADEARLGELRAAAGVEAPRSLAPPVPTGHDAAASRICGAVAAAVSPPRVATVNKSSAAVRRLNGTSGMQYNPTGRTQPTEKPVGYAL